MKRELISFNCTSTTKFSITTNHEKEMAYHTRSNSFPSRSHPLIQEVDEQLCRLRSSEASSTSSSSSSISYQLHGLQDLHDCVDRLLQLPLNQQALAQEKHGNWANELLDRSLRLLDICSTAKDALLLTKECIQNLQSIIRRRGGEESDLLASEVRKYFSSRKMVKKSLHKAMGNLKGIENKYNFSSLSKDQETIAIINKLRDVEAVTQTVFEAILSFITGPKVSSSWSFISKKLQSKRVACEEEQVNEFAEVDAALKSHKSLDNAQNQLNNLETCIQDQEEGLECLFRQLIKTRVSLLNILNH
uniref:uncharacterized protein LOC101304250 n=1 Tax=Fragaria vesca subsp. vesca TaxID=101020 RepID=UPI0005C8A12C|nr:PREDICTED: uncharacterized protein LOC101304250 [Fragaria vesca subsp. vesca]